MVKTYKKGKAVKLSASFTSTEFDCHGKNCCSETKIDDKLIIYLQKLRDHFGQSITINSGYRCKTHNKAVGGAAKSRHMALDGVSAADIAVKNTKPEAVAKFAESIGILGIGLYPWGCHIDTRTTKSFWYGDKYEYRSTFGGTPSSSSTSKTKENLKVKAWQEAAIKDGFSFPSGADGKWGKECEAVARKAVCKYEGITYKNKNLTKFLQEALGIKKIDGKYGPATKAAVEVFQEKVGLIGADKDGKAGYKTWKKVLEIS
jgi:hypothetical protein